MFSHEPTADSLIGNVIFCRRIETPPRTVFGQGQCLDERNSLLGGRPLAKGLFCLPCTSSQCGLLKMIQEIAE